MPQKHRKNKGKTEKELFRKYSFLRCVNILTFLSKEKYKKIGVSDVNLTCILMYNVLEFKLKGYTTRLAENLE